MTDYGITEAGFVIKPFSTILEEKLAQVQQLFGDDIDLRSTSAIRKLLDVTSAEDHELWKKLERTYYACFISTAFGDALTLLGADIGVPRRFLYASGEVKLTLSSGSAGREYNLPPGTLLETDPPERLFRTLELVTLTNDEPEMKAPVEALARGPEGNVAAGDINKINSIFMANRLNLGTAVIAVTNESTLTGGDLLEDDESYRAHLLGYPRTLWTLEAVDHAVRSVDGVRDCRLSDPLGGTDVSQSVFARFLYSQRRFGRQRLAGSHYYFDILVATEPGYEWESEGGIIGVEESIEEAIREVRPVSIFPNLYRANNVIVGIRAQILIESGHDRDAIVATIKDKLTVRINALGLGTSVLYSDVMLDCKSTPGVIDVQQLRLRRCPPQFGRVSIGGPLRFQGEMVEAAVGENLVLAPVEIAVFQIDSDLLSIEVSDR